MATDPQRAATWRDAKVVSVDHHGELGVILRLHVPDRVVHRPGQHYVLRLRAEDGYTASRSYSAVSGPAEDLVELYVEKVPDGEVSGFLAEVVEPGDVLECRGPIGRWFAWDGATPALGIGGGSGVAPLVSMLRHARAVGRPELLHLAVSAWTAEHLPYREELEAAGALVAYSRQKGGSRLDAAVIAAIADPGATAFVCGSARFTLAMESHLLSAGQPEASIRIERFGPTGENAEHG
ncbi:ferredoxin reductase [Actinomycetospora corticicola]|uniref:Ferredoxin-NADP reductase n=1 Tax=Actinomycetospora corticicola TaxID=663602 RepID=A0A7Y9J7Z4_9PSEU|nr:FAD-binding oxidoreductase [Actinomycetospora corticicola]NYD38753.1 ferredoxin-NADP reductase [Actinomycetospora corticicola]